MHDVFIVDEEFDQAAKNINDICGKIDALIQQYVNILNSLIYEDKEGKMEGDTANALSAFTEYARHLLGEAGKLAASHQTAERNFLSQVDDTDSYLYG